jgi:hypothetical protein
VHNRYREWYNTRAALRLIRSLHEATEEAAVTFSPDR